MPATTSVRMDKALDGARILWRWFLAAEDREAAEGHVREFTVDGEWVRVAETTFNDDKGRWLRCSDIRVLAVLEEKVAPIARPRAKRRNGDECADGEGTES